MKSQVNPKRSYGMITGHEGVERTIVEQAVQDSLQWLIQQDQALQTREEPSHDQI